MFVYTKYGERGVNSLAIHVLNHDLWVVVLTGHEMLIYQEVPLNAKQVSGQVLNAWQILVYVTSQIMSLCV